MAVRIKYEDVHVFVNGEGDVVVYIDKSLANELMESVLEKYGLNTSDSCIREAWEHEIGRDAIHNALFNSLEDELDICAGSNDWPDSFNDLQCPHCGKDLRKYGVVQNADSFFAFNASGNTISFKSHGGAVHYCVSCGNKLDLDELGIEVI